MVYIAADNDLEVFVDQNLKQMMRIGSNQNINIIAQVNTSESCHQKKESKTFYIEKNSRKIIKSSTKHILTDSGDPKTLIQFCTQCIKEFPAEHYALIFWNHGTGSIDPFLNKSIHSSDLFQFPEAATNNSFHFFKFLDPSKLEPEIPVKGVCFDDTTGNFLTESKIRAALKAITEQCLEGKKIDIIGFDACLMAMIEIGSSIKDYANYMVASQEVELGTGWDYKRVLLPFQFEVLTPDELGAHIVTAYSKTYSFIDDFTLSCLDLRMMEEIEKSLTALFTLLKAGLKNFYPSVFEMMQLSRFAHSCTHFDEPDFIDIQHLLENILYNVELVQSENNYDSLNFQINIIAKLKEILALIKKMVLANKTGSFFPNARGVSIYFPDYKIHRSYRKNRFAYRTQWFSFLQDYLYR